MNVQKLNADEENFFLLAIDKTEGSSFLVWWKPGNDGYTVNLHDAGVYTIDQINADPAYYNNEECVPIPISKAWGLFVQTQALNDIRNLVKLDVLEPYLKYKEKFR